MSMILQTSPNVIGRTAVAYHRAIRNRTEAYPLFSDGQIPMFLREEPGGPLFSEALMPIPSHPCSDHPNSGLSPHRYDPLKPDGRYVPGGPGFDGFFRFPDGDAHGK